MLKSLYTISLDVLSVSKSSFAENYLDFQEFFMKARDWNTKHPTGIYT